MPVTLQVLLGVNKDIEAESVQIRRWPSTPGSTASVQVQGLDLVMSCVPGVSDVFLPGMQCMEAAFGI